MTWHRSVIVSLCVGAGLALAAGVGFGRASTQTASTAVRCSNTAAAPRFAGVRLDLTGIYEWRQAAAKFYVRQSGTCVYLMGQNGHGPQDPHPVGKGFTTIYVGGILPNLDISGLWSDVPYGDVTGHGHLTWKVGKVGGKLALTVRNNTGGWGADQIVLIKKVTPQG